MPCAVLSEDDFHDFQLPTHVRYALGILSGCCGPADDILNKMHCLHPVESQDIPASCRASLLEEYSPHFGMLSAAARFNCFSSGLYLASSLVNHSCNPNCGKFSITETAFCLPATEIVATRDINQDEEITITYFGSVELSHSSRVQRFLSQHCAQLPRTPFTHPLDHLPTGVEQLDVEALEVQLDELALPVDSTNMDDSLSIAARLRSMRSCAASLCGSGHLVCIRITRMLIAANAAIMGSVDCGVAVGVTAALDIVKDGLHLLPLMESYLGTEHCDVATLLLDLSNALDYLFAAGDKRVYTFSGMSTYSAASRIAYAMKQRSKRIQQLYMTGNSLHGETKSLEHLGRSTRSAGEDIR
jgi:hypothetical protein